MTPEGDMEMIRWHDREHVAERVGVPGFLRGRRYAHATAPRQYLDFYETESVETIRSDPYLARLNNPTPWTQRVLPHFRDTFRIGCRVLASVGRAQSGTMLTLRLGPAKGRDADLRSWITGAAPAELAEPTGVVGVHVLETMSETTSIRTAEGKLKGGEVGAAEVVPPFVLVVEVTDPRGADALLAGPLAGGALAAHGAAPNPVAGVYRLQLTMDRE
jgi:hypothetical protein